ncbi:SGNH/GDSL hydrolase family protein [Janthinobacterium sp. PC23-8]|uniref:SGNH/GDSL hydrolase family protein n=1 Tax=Janthinobacterium sp. PC23-8 TaxID=2012679 RepID=UPI00114027B0|nr:SGNH/GDSL hydrolase family protein [Janthinobacterium sp. PC23-8]
MSLRYKILFITDSLAFPRAEPEFVSYEETYIAYLKHEFPDCDFIHQGRGGATIVDLFTHTAYFHETLRADLVFIQSGIVDCAPRALTVMEQHVVSRLPVLGRLLTSLVKKYSRWLRKNRKITYTSVDRFSAYIKKFESLFPNVYWIGILPATGDYEAKIEGIQQNVEIYNNVLRKTQMIETTMFKSIDIMSDHHHLNAAGHRKMYASLAAIIRKELSLKEPNDVDKRPASTYIPAIHPAASSDVS